MASIGTVELAILALLGVLVVLVVVAPGRWVQVRREWRLVQLTRVAGVVVGLVLASVVPDDTGLEPAVFGLCVLVAVVLGETVVRPRRPGGARTASLSPRRVRDYAPRHLARAAMASSVATVALTLVSITVLRTDPGSGRTVLLGCGNDWPAIVKTDPMVVTPTLAVLLTSILLVGAVAARQVVRRPRGMGATTDDDDALRRRSLAVVTAAVGFATAATGSSVVNGLAEAAGQSTTGASCLADSPWADALQVVGAVVGLLFIGLTLYCVLELLLGRAVAPRRPRSRESAPR